MNYKAAFELDADDLETAKITLKVRRKGCACGGKCYREIEVSWATLEAILVERTALRVLAIQATNKEPASVKS